MDNVKISIDRAMNLLKTPNNYEKYISIKIKPKQELSCCCFHCWPYTWKAINSMISQYGIIEDEGDVLIGEGEDRFILECHESGPEIIVYVPIGIAALTLITNIINLIINIIKNRQKEKSSSRFIITKRIIRNSKIIEENIIEVDFPFNDDNIKLLNDKILNIFK
jgi:hypothetical protein